MKTVFPKDNNTMKTMTTAMLGLSLMIGSAALSLAAAPQAATTAAPTTDTTKVKKHHKKHMKSAKHNKMDKMDTTATPAAK